MITLWWCGRVEVSSLGRDRWYAGAGAGERGQPTSNADADAKASLKEGASREIAMPLIASGRVALPKMDVRRRRRRQGISAPAEAQRPEPPSKGVWGKGAKGQAHLRKATTAEITKWFPADDGEPAKDAGTSSKLDNFQRFRPDVEPLRRLEKRRASPGGDKATPQQKQGFQPAAVAGAADPPCSARTGNLSSGACTRGNLTTPSIYCLSLSTLSLRHCSRPKHDPRC